MSESNVPTLQGPSSSATSELPRRQGPPQPRQPIAIVLTEPSISGKLTAGRAVTAGAAAASPAPSARFDVRHPVGAGGMGAVYAVRDGDLRRMVALKTLHGDDAEAAGVVHRLIREAQMIGRLEHPNIVPVYDLGVDAAGVPFFTMKLVSGTSLAQVIERLRQGDPATWAEFTLERRLQIMLRVCEALCHAHARGVVHRDLKPHNVMVGEFGEVYVVDWGLAVLVGADDDAAEPAPIGRVTKSGAVVGTPRYMAPEQATGAPPDPAVDVYGLGATMYELFALTPIRVGDGTMGFVYEKLFNDPVPPHLLSVPHQGTVPISIGRLIMRALARDPARRIPSAAALRDEIQDELEGRTRISCPYTAARRAGQAVGRWLDAHYMLATAMLYVLAAALVVGLVRWLT